MRPDVIVVGAGSSGAVIARRLTEQTDCVVLLLEAGPDYGGCALPRDLADGTRNSMAAHDWGYRHRPTSLDREFALPRGRVVGGSSAVNTCIALRGQPEDYDEWAARGLPEWSWRSCLPAFKRLERDLDLESAWHGRDGPLPIRRHPPSEWVPIQAAFVEACLELGFAPCYDSNEPGSAGVGPHAMNKIDGRRISVAEAYLTAEVRNRPNLKIRPDTLLRRVLLDDRKVVGVEVEDAQGHVEVVHAPRVVLCAGALNTPAALLRSGIGAREEVERMGCTLTHDLPQVNRRLLDHPGTAIGLIPRVPTPESLTHPLIQTVLRYASEGSAHTSDMLLQPGSRLPLAHCDLPLIGLMCSVGKPRGTGKVRWTSADPRARPIIESRLLDDAYDRALATEAMLLAHELMHTRALSSVAMHFWPSERVLRSRRSVDAWIRGACDSSYHPCGTVPMGADDDPDAATDGRGRLRGIEGLTIGDASLMPTIPSSNIHLPTLMVAERIAEFLSEELT